MTDTRPMLPYTEKLTIDQGLVLSKENFLEDLKSLTSNEARTKDKQLDSVIAYPDTYIFAKLASKAYKDKKSTEAQSDYEKRLELPQGWKLLTTATSKAFNGIITGYFGAAFWQPARRRIVIAHRGTKPTNLDALRADLKGILSNEYVKQMNAACTFAHKIYQAVTDFVEKRSMTCDFEIFFTGHSLGAWLAQITTFSLKYLKPEGTRFLKNPNHGYHAHAEVFDSPGCSDMLLQMTKDFDVRYSGKTTKLDNLDITTYLSSPNMVNCCNLHVGRLFRVYPEISSDKYLSYTKSSHSMGGILKTFESPSKIKEVINWPKINLEFWQWKIWETPKKLMGKEYKEFFDWAKDTNDYDPKAEDMTIEVSITNEDNPNERKYVIVPYQTKPVRWNECGTAVFTDSELKFLRRFQQLKVIPNSVLDVIELSDEFRNKVTNKLRQLTVHDDYVTVTNECNRDLRQLVPYLKKLLRLYPNLHEKVEMALTDFVVRKEIYQDITKTYRQKMDILTRMVSECDWVEFRAFLESVNDNNQICLISTPFGTDLTAAKVLKSVELIERKFLIFAFELQNVLTTEIFFKLTEFLKNDKLREYETLLLLECKDSLFVNPDRKYFVQNLIYQVKERSNVKLVLITNDEDASNQSDRVTLIKHGGIKWNELTNEARRKVISTPLIEFQGNQDKISLKDFLGDISIESTLGQFADILEPETLAKFVRNEVLTVGKVLDNLGDVLDYYIPRKFNYSPFIQPEVFDNATYKELITVSHSDASIDHRDLGLVETNCDEDFQALCDINLNKNVHWLKYNDDTKLIWYQTRGSLDFLRKYVQLGNCLQYSEDSILDNFGSNKTLIISDTPGMGKSTVLSVLAEKIKSKSPNYWVIRVNLNACAKALETAIENEVSIKTSIEASRFMLEKILPCSPSTVLTSSLERKLFEHALIKRGGVVLIFDAFDEISPDYERGISMLLETLLKTTLIEKLVLTTRPHTKEQLENRLSTWSHTMVPFTVQNQIDFLVQFCQKRLTEVNAVNIRKYAEESIEILTKSINDLERELMGIPLQCRLLAEYVLKKIKAGDNGEIENLSLMELYEDFVEGKMQIYNEEKSRNPDGNISASNANKFMETGILNLHRQYALQLLLSKNVWIDLDYPVIDEGKKAVETEVMKAGLVYKSLDNPQFIHRTFAEYFVLDYLLKLAKLATVNPRKLTLLTREILLKPEFIVIRVFLDVLIRNCKRSEETFSILRCFVQYVSNNWFDNRNSCVNVLEETALHVLLREKHCYVLKTFIDILTSDLIKPEVLSSFVQWPEKRGKTALYVAVWNGDIQSVKVLLDNDAEVDVCSEGNFSPLYLASQFGRIDIVKMLVERGSKVNACTHNKWSPLMVAALHGRTEVVAFLLENDADFEARSDKGWTSLHSASQNDHQDIVQLLINVGATVDCRTVDNWTPLHVVASYGYLGIANLLIENHAEVDALTYLNFTPLHYACDNNNLEIVRALLAKGSKVNSVTVNDPPVSHRETPLHLAVQEGHVEVARCLLNYGADSTIQNSHDETPLDRARFCNKYEIVKLLEK